MRRIVLPALLASGAPAAAADVQNWDGLVVQGPVTGRLLLWGEVQGRLVDDVSRVGQVLARTGLGLRLGRNVDVYAGYAWQHYDGAPANARDEHRIWQQISAPLWQGAGGVQLSTRWRLEQRMFEGARDTGWRLRGQLRLALPLRGPGSFGPLLWSETFYEFNSTDWGAREGLNQQRSFAGALVPVTGNLALEAGYMHQYVKRPAGDRGNHVASLTLIWRLGQQRRPGADHLTSGS